MSRSDHRGRRVLLPAVAAAALVLSGCASGQVSQTATQVAAIDGANGSTGAITVLNARLSPPPRSEYPAGGDARLLLWISNEGDNPDTLSSITTPAAQSVRITGDATIPAQYLADLSGVGGTRAVLENLTEDVVYGVSIPMTFNFANAGSIALNVPVEVPVERSGERETIPILPPHPTPLWEEGVHAQEELAAQTTGTAATGATTPAATTGQGQRTGATGPATSGPPTGAATTPTSPVVSPAEPTLQPTAGG